AHRRERRRQRLGAGRNRLIGLPPAPLRGFPPLLRGCAAWRGDGTSGPAEPVPRCPRRVPGKPRAAAFGLAAFLFAGWPLIGCTGCAHRPNMLSPALSTTA